MDTTTTGIPALDKSLMDGIPKGFTLLVAGPPGSGTELLAKQFASAGINGENVVYFSTTERDRDVISTMEHFGWKSSMKIVNIADQYYKNVLAKELEISRYRQEGITMKDIMAPTKEKEERKGVNFLTALTYETSRLKPPFRVVVDSLDFFMEYYEHMDVLSSLRTIKGHTQHQEGVALLTMLTGVYATRTQSSVEEIVDCSIELQRERKENAFKNYLIIRKVRNHPEMTGIYEYKITKEGITPK
ncbi:MAG: RAD55 family ATPase [Thermoplasmata archaeon]